MKTVKVGQKKDFKDVYATGIEVEGKSICIARVGDLFYAFDNRCTHAESELSGGDIEDNELACPLHGARFDVRTGAAMTLPAVKPVKTYKVHVEGDNVLVEFDPN